MSTKEPQPQLPGVDWKPTELRKKLDSNQREMSDWLRRVWPKYRLIVVNASRQLGKSFWLVDDAVVYGLENPGAQIKYGAKTQKHVRKIIRPHLREIFRLMPEAFRPVWSQEDGEYVFHNDATLTVAGCDKDYAESLVGQHAHMFIIDEGGAIKDLEYVVRDIALPQTLNTGGRLIIASTPARQGGHAFKSFCDEALEHGTYIERDIFHNPRISDQTIREMCQVAGGPQSSTWQREYLVKHVTDESTAGLPEATLVRLKAITLTEQQLELTRSPWVDLYVSVAPMWNPRFTGIVWAHFDFRRNRLVVEDSAIVRTLDTDKLSELLAGRCEALWGRDAEIHKSIVCSDEEGMLIELGDSGWTMLPATVPELALMPGGEKARVALQKLRHSVTHRRGPKLYLHERAEDMRRELQAATWDKTRKKFEPSKVDGSFPLVTALAALRQDMNEKHDATPENAAGRRWIVHPDYGQSQRHAAVKRLFGVRR
jgi:hypothetical protein